MDPLFSSLVVPGSLGGLPSRLLASPLPPPGGGGEGRGLGRATGAGRDPNNPMVGESGDTPTPTQNRSPGFPQFLAICEGCRQAGISQRKGFETRGSPCCFCPPPAMEDRALAEGRQARIETPLTEEIHSASSQLLPAPPTWGGWAAEEAHRPSLLAFPPWREGQRLCSGGGGSLSLRPPRPPLHGGGLGGGGGEATLFRAKGTKRSLPLHRNGMGRRTEGCDKVSAKRLLEDRQSDAWL